MFAYFIHLYNLNTLNNDCYLGDAQHILVEIINALRLDIFAEMDRMLLLNRKGRNKFNIDPFTVSVGRTWATWEKTQKIPPTRPCSSY